LGRVPRIAIPVLSFLASPRVGAGLSDNESRPRPSNASFPFAVDG
jgi:hypothetical protein